MEFLRGQSTWLVTGAAGFIGMHLVRSLLLAGQRVRGIDNFITGQQSRLDYLKKSCTAEQWERFEFIKGDLTNLNTALQICEGIDFVLHQAALGSVPRSIKDPLNTHRHNVDAFINTLFAAKEKEVRRFVFASSSSVYGDNPTLPKQEDHIGRPLSPYAASKQIDETYALVFQRTYGIECVGLRYFNVFGPGQDPQGPYAAVIPLWINSLLKNENVYINGDGQFSRDFCFVDNVVRANILAATAGAKETGQIYNVACGEQTNLNELYAVLREEVGRFQPDALTKKAIYRESRTGDVPHSLANINKVKINLGYEPLVKAKEGLKRTVAWYIENPFLLDQRSLK
jgi:UDP-N-acetylglucosamine/UDP-N-acetyl-alpha-D-glucosaminouronate 4-epimerase